MNTKARAIQNILKDFENLSTLVLQQLNNVENLLAQKIEDKDLDNLYTKLESNEEEIDSFETKINEDIIDTIVLYHPLAGELRNMMSCMRMLSNLERIGDLAINISGFIKRVDNDKLPNIFYPSLLKMLILSKKMAQDAINSFLCEDIDLAHKTIKADEKVDEIYDNISFSLLEDKIIEKYNDKTSINSLICINNIALNLERIGDNSTNIAESAVYMLQGMDIRHVK